MSRNYGLGTRDMASAGRIALAQAAKQGGLSFASVDALSDRWSQFAAFAKGAGVGRMERITRELVQQYGQSLAGKVSEKALSPGYAQNLVSAINTVLGIASGHRWTPVSPTVDCQIAQRATVRASAPTDLKASLSSSRTEMIALLAREFGLRSKEASLLDSRKAVEEGQKRGVITVREGTKGGRARTVPIVPSQLKTLQRAAQIQGKEKNLIPADQSWKTWRNGELRAGREALKGQGIHGYHELRAIYACNRYQQLTGLPAPVMGGKIENKTLDYQARMVISAELGHGRVEVVSAYIGGRS